MASNLEVFTCTVGKKPSAAANYISDVTEVQELLDALVKVSTRDQKYYSSIDLRNYAQEGLSNALNRFDNGMVRTGMAKSMSLDQLEAIDDPAEKKDPPAISANLGEYLGAIEDQEEDDDEPFFF